MKRRKFRRTTRSFTTRTFTTIKRFKSPFAATFISGVRQGTPCSIVVTNIAKKTGKNAVSIFKSLHKAGLCSGQKINGQWVYWPTFKTPVNSTNSTVAKTSMWQCFVDWCICSGVCTPNQMNRKSITTKAFATFCKSGFGKTVVVAGTTKTRKTRKTRKTTKRRTTRTRMHKRYTTKRTSRTTRKNWTGKRNWSTVWNSRNNKIWRSTGWNTKNYKFPVYRNNSSTTSRRYRKAA